MHLRAVAVVGFLVGLAGSEVEGARDFFIKEDVTHGFLDAGMEAEGKLADVACSRIGIEDLVELFGLGAGFGLDDFSLLEFQVDVIEGDTLIDGGGVVGDVALDTILNWGGEHFSVGNIVVTSADNGGDILDRETQVGAFVFDVHLIGFLHQSLQCAHRRQHGFVVGQTDVEVEVLKGLRAHARLLGHG